MSSLAKILTVVLLSLSVGLFVYLYASVQDVIDTREAITRKESAITDKLKLIREAEIVFLAVHGRYTSNWDSLSNFIAHGQVPIVQRREEIIQKAYGGEDVIVHVDTLGFVPALEKIFKRSYTISAADMGTFVEYKVKVGDAVVRSQKALMIKVGNRENEQTFLEEGTVVKLTPVTKGDAVQKGQGLIFYENYIFDPKTDLSRIGFKPGSETKFEIFTGKVDKAGSLVQVIEVKDPTPENPLRKESNEQKARKPLRFGSRYDISTAGNWE